MSDVSSILDHKDYWDEYLPLPLKDHGIVLRRDEQGDPPRGTVKTNVPHRVEQGSPDGFEFGYGGSGPSDLALNAVEHLIQHLADEGVIEEPSEYYTAEEGEVHEGRVSKLAFRLAPEFKAEFIAPAPTSGGTIEYEALKAWILERPEIEAHNPLANHESHMPGPSYPLLFECSNCDRETTVTREDARGLYPDPDSQNAPDVVLQERGWMRGEIDGLLYCPDCANPGV